VILGLLEEVGGTVEEGEIRPFQETAMQGWRVVYLGTSLPAEEVAGAAIQTGTRAVGVSVVYPSASRKTLSEHTRLLKLLPDETPPTHRWKSRLELPRSG
jgi:hypothetical protein